MNVQFSDAFNDLIREKRIDKKLLMETPAAGFTSAVKKKLGSTAEVWEAIEDSTQERFALKVLKESIAKNRGEVSLLKHEFNVALAARGNQDSLSLQPVLYGG